jgi:c-di-GMP-binding flagellar brake protein YcgR
MTKRAAPKKKSKKFPKELSVNRRREWRFDLPLKTVIEGKLPAGKTFHEETKLENISSGGAYFCLDSGVVVGSKLNLMIELPDKLTDGKKMKLWIGGITVRLEKPNLKSRKQGVAVRFSDDFKVLPAAKKK